MYAVILAGGKINPKNELYAESKGLTKAMIDIHGKPMVQWVIDAANKAKSVEKLIIAGLPDFENLRSGKPVQLLNDQGGIVENLSAAAKIILNEAPETEYFVSITADIPLIQAEIIEKVIDAGKETGYDFLFHIVEKKAMDASYPGVKRTYFRLRDGRFCGGDMHLICPKVFVNPAYYKLVEYRKNPIRMITMFGFGVLLRMIFYPPTLAMAAKIVNERLGFSGKAVISDEPAIGMDIDTMHHLAISREKLAQGIDHE